MPSIRGGHLKKMNADRKERLQALLLREPYLENRALATRFGLGMSTVQEIRKALITSGKIEKISSPYVTNVDLRGKFNAKISCWHKRNERGL